MTISTILAIAIPPLIGAIGAVVLFQIIDRIVEAQRHKRAAHRETIAA